MSDTKGLLERIAALRTRLDQGPVPVRLEEKTRQGAWHNRLIDATLRPLDPVSDTPAVLPERLTASAARLLKKGKDLLEALRALSDDPILTADADGPLAVLHQGGAALVEIVLRSVQAFPSAPSAQIRLVEGLELVLEAAEDQLETLVAGLGQKRRDEGRIDYVAELLRGLAAGQAVNLEALQRVADQLSLEAQSGQPLRFLHADPVDPSRFAAAHGLTTAQVLARVLKDDPDWQSQLQLALMTALVHDAGMVRIPAQILTQSGPLDVEQRRLLERHTVLGGTLVAPLWPGGGWPVEAVTDHHERSDGTGYPRGRKEIQLGAFVRLLSVCDVYAAMGAVRPHRAARDTRHILTDLLLMAEHGHFDRAQAERLLALSFYPVGSIVELDDGAAAVVLAVHDGPRGLANPTRPVVQLLTGAAGQTLALPGIIDLAEQQDRHISRNLTRAERHRLLLKRFPQLI
jgi:hypothetical protein